MFTKGLIFIAFMNNEDINNLISNLVHIFICNLLFGVCVSLTMWVNSLFFFLHYMLPTELMKLYFSKSFPIKGLYMHSVVACFSLFFFVREYLRSFSEPALTHTHLILIFFIHEKIFAHIYNKFCCNHKTNHNKDNIEKLYNE